ncbi:MAG: hypothetical protein Unbinned7015contig1001_6 [Prokaryotic dsDNA virus sp.]|nr:MAG: hypothetical protein Unbinned7015contig1001_6 [Prokaryotic dsDNA virus sp.]|tara:strand:- start:12785 stop:13009 length:225 start_codon:yes stop_codon:yes gene_type:complete
MRVRAKQRGIYGPRRWKPGMEFDLDSPRQFNASWMEVVEEAKAEEPKAPAKRKPGRPKKQPKEDKPSASEQTEV